MFMATIINSPNREDLIISCLKSITAAQLVGPNCSPAMAFSRVPLRMVS